MADMARDPADADAAGTSAAGNPYPQPPPLISKYVDSVLRDNAFLLAAAKRKEQKSVKQSVAMLELAHSNLLHLGRLADIQTIRHGLPPASTDFRQDCGLGPRDELLQTLAMALTAYHMVPPKKRRPEERAQQSAEASAASSQTAGGAAEASSSGAAAGDSQAAVAGVDAVGADVPAAAGRPGSQAGPGSSPADPMPQPAAMASDDIPINPDGTAKARTKWTLEEIMMFENGVRQFGLHKPAQIAAFMGTRGPEQVRERIKWMKRKVGILKKWPGKGQGGAGEDGAEGGGAS